jgi:hypothetical protein
MAALLIGYFTAIAIATGMALTTAFGFGLIPLGL